MSTKKICFVIAPIGDPDSETRKRSDQILKHIITPAVNECYYEPIRADKISEPGLITSQVIQHIMDDPLVIADLTERNPNVFYELAIRHAIRKPLVQIIKKGETIPFDVAGTRTIPVDHRDLDSVEEAKREIVRQIKSVEKNPSLVDSPISVSLDLQILRQSDNPEQRSLADILSAISELRSTIVSIEKKIDASESGISSAARRIYIDPSYKSSTGERKLAWQVLDEEVQARSALTDEDIKTFKERLLQILEKNSSE
jgi:hypothetical protein